MKKYRFLNWQSIRSQCVKKWMRYTYNNQRNGSRQEIKILVAPFLRQGVFSAFFFWAERFAMPFHKSAEAFVKNRVKRKRLSPCEIIFFLCSEARVQREAFSLPLKMGAHIFNERSQGAELLCQVEGETPPR